MTAPDEEGSLIYVPAGGERTRTFPLPPSRVRLVKRLVWLLGALVVVFTSSWVYLAFRAARVGPLERRIAQLEEERARMAELAETVEALEARYGQLRSLFGVGGEAVASEMWVPPPSGTRTGDGDDRVGDDPMPSSWPLTQRGFVTQPRLEGVDAAAHPGLDIAVPADSYIRAAGAGVVAEVGEDTVYGRYIVLDHGNGYRTRYAHANLVLAAEGSEVRRNEVIALSGNTGRSTAPHLHFEVRLDGQAVDPLTLVQQPA